MFGPPALTHAVYIFLVVAFLCVVSYAVYYNLKMKSRDKELGLPGGAEADTASKIRAEKRADERAHGK